MGLSFGICFAIRLNHLQRFLVVCFHISECFKKFLWSNDNFDGLWLCFGYALIKRFNGFVSLNRWHPSIYKGVITDCIAWVCSYNLYFLKCWYNLQLVTFMYTFLKYFHDLIFVKLNLYCSLCDDWLAFSMSAY